jgi:hypothetical protein
MVYSPIWTPPTEFSDHLDFAGCRPVFEANQIYLCDAENRRFRHSRIGKITMKAKP